MDPTSCAPACRFKSQNATTLEKHRKGCSTFLEYEAQGLRRRKGAQASRQTQLAAQRASRRERNTQRGRQLERETQRESQTPRLAGTETPSHSNYTESLNTLDSLPVPSTPEPTPELPSHSFDDTPMDADTSTNTSLAPPRPRRNLGPVQDLLPERAPTLNDTIPGALGAAVRRVRLVVRDSLTTLTNSLGLWRHYRYRPTFDPDSFVPSSDLAKSSAVYNTLSDPIQDFKKYEHPNKTHALLSEWQNSGSSQKSHVELDRLVKDVLQHPDFNVEDLKKFRAQRVANEIDKLADANPSLLDNFETTAVPINVPLGSRDQPSKTFEIPGLHYRPLLSLIRSAFAHPLAAQFHLTPFKLYHTPPTKPGEQPDEESEASVPDERVYSELYDSDAFLDEHKNVQTAPTDDPDCKREKVVAALMFWSDATHLADFGTAKLWPIYMFLGNLSKYVRAMPNSGACQHVAYIPSLPDSFTARLAEWHSKPNQIPNILAHCRRELMQAVWKILLDEDFAHAFKYGIVIKCIDGVERRVYPRIFTYSADYPEKVLLATMRDNGTCLCPRCMVTKAKADQLGTGPDGTTRTAKVRTYLADSIREARDWIYRMGRGVKSSVVEDLLKETSSVPVENAFITRLGPLFDLPRMMVPDFMHEFELGVWKGLFTHLVRLLHSTSQGARTVAQLDERFRQIGTFGNSTIRSFQGNTSEMKKLAARDFEDILQCSIPVFDGLLEDERHDEENNRTVYPNRQLMTLLYRAAEFHAFAKMRLHTESTLKHLEKVTAQFGRLIRRFRDEVCTLYETYELPSEADRRARRQIREQNSRPGTSAGPRVASGRRQKVLNLCTYKFHSLGDYAQFIRLFGGSDSFSTQIGELAHRLVKRLYGMTNKRSVAQQIGRRVRRIEHARAAGIRRMQQHQLMHVTRGKPRRSNGTRPASDVTADSGDRSLKFNVSSSQKSRGIDVPSLLMDKRGDPLYENFASKLRAHILSRCIGRPFDGDNHDDFSAQDLNTIRIVDNRIYEVGTLHVNYTTYDNRRDFDVINPKTHADIMVPSQEDNKATHPFWYARVVKIYHAVFDCTHPQTLEKGERRMTFLLVRWLGAEPGYTFGFRTARLPKVGFVKYDPNFDDFAFGFLDPAQVLRGCHLIPDFRSEQTLDLLPFYRTDARPQEPFHKDWTSYYVNIFVDRDMVMRHYGGGIGHHNPRTVEDVLVPEEGVLMPDKEPNVRSTVTTSEPDSNDEGGRSDEDDHMDWEGYDDNEDSLDSATDDDDDGYYASD